MADCFSLFKIKWLVINLAKVTSFSVKILPDLAVNSFHQSYAMNMRKAQETRSSVRLLAVTTSTVFSTHHILTPGIIDSLSLFRFYMNLSPFFDTKQNLSSKTLDCLLPSPGD